jgi:hypothetical protein
MTNANDPSNPVMPSHGTFKGLTKREYFAAMAIQGLCASGFYTEKKLQIQAEKLGSNITDCIAISAIDLADGLIKELNIEEK